MARNDIPANTQLSSAYVRKPLEWCLADASCNICPRQAPGDAKNNTLYLTGAYFLPFSEESGWKNLKYWVMGYLLTFDNRKSRWQFIF